MVILDSNIIIEILKGNEKVTKKIEEIGLENICLTYITVMEVTYGARDKQEKKMIEEFLTSFKILYSNKDVDLKAVEIVSEFALSHNAQIPDAIIAAIAIYYDYELITYNLKDFKYIPDIKVKRI